MTVVRERRAAKGKAIAQRRSPTGPKRFQTTQWSVVVAAGNRGSPESAQAIASLCTSYWFPLYAYIRSRGYQPAEAEDLTQAFLLRLLDRDALALVDRERGRFRAFLLTALKNYLVNERERTLAKKRGGGRIRIGLDFNDGERRFAAEPVSNMTPERTYERQWALTLLEAVLGALREEYAANGRERLFGHLKIYLTASASHPAYDVLAEKCQMSTGAVKTAVYRLRRRFREILRQQIAQTVATAEEIDGEIQELFDALRG